MGKKPKDITGNRYGRLVAVESTGLKNKSGQYIWKFICDCGNDHIVTGTSVIEGSSKSCGCYNLDLVKERSTIHGKSGSNRYAVWNKIKARIFDIANESYPDYGGRGLKMSEEFVVDMDAFYNHLGDKPRDGNKYTVGRIDNNIGYVLGNIRWETYSEQSRNKRKASSNTSNFTGVVWTSTKSKNSVCTYAVARWIKNNKQFTKSFSVKKLGLLPAFKAACEYRECVVRTMGYSQNHGK